MRFRRATKRTFTAALAFWMSGAIVLFCCGTMPAKAADAESCPLAKKGRCTKTPDTGSAKTLGQNSSSFDCCAFPAKIFDKIRKIEKSPEAAVAVQAVKVGAPKMFSVAKFSGSNFLYQSFVSNRSATHLQNCVFRI